MGIESYIGRVGALAVALGVGAAIGTSPGLSWAQADSSSESDAAGGSTSNAPTTPPDREGTGPGDPASPDGPATDAENGADTQDADLDVEESDDDAPDDSATSEPDTGQEDDAVTDDQDGARQAAQAGSDNDSNEMDDQLPSASRVTEPASSSETESDPDIVTDDDIDTSVPITNESAHDDFTALRMVATAKSVAPQQDSAPAPKTLISTTTRLVTTILSPFLGSGPDTPTPSAPLLWTVLAFTRREVGNFIAALTPPASSTATGQLMKTAAPETLMTSLAAPNAAAAAAPSPGAVGAVVITVSSALKLVVGLVGGLLGTNKAPTVSPTIGNPDAVTGVITGGLGAKDPNNDPLTYTVSTPPAYGAVNVSSTGAFTYTPSPRANALSNPVTDNFAITVSDGRGGTTTATFANVPVKPQNRAPLNGTFNAGAPTAFGVVSGTVSATDPDGDTLAFAAPLNTGKGTVGINSSTGVFTYTPTPAAQHAATAGGAAAQDSFIVTVTDGRGGSLPVTVNVAVKPANQNPVNGSFHADDPVADGVVHGTVTATDPDDDPLTYTGTHTTADGSTVVVTTDGAIGRFIYTPSTAAREAAAATSITDKYMFDVVVADGHTGSLTVPVTVTVDPATVPPVNQPPGDEATVEVDDPDPEDGSVTGTVTVEDPDGDELTYTVTDPPEHGTVDMEPDGTFTFTPDPDDRLDAALTRETDTVTFGVTATDPDGATSEVPVTVPIEPAASLPAQSGDRPQFIAFNKDGSLAYVTNQDADTVSVVDTRTLRVVGTPIAVGDAPTFIERAPDGKIWVLNRDADTISVIDPMTNTVVGDPIHVGHEPSGITFGPNNIAYVANRATVSPGVSVGDSISVIDTTNNHVIHTIDTPSPVAVALNSDATELWVTNQYAGTVSVFDTTTYEPVVAPISMFGSNPYPTIMAFTPDGSRVYITNQFDDDVKVIDTATYTWVDTISVGFGRTPAGLAISADGTRAYVANFSGRNYNDLRPGSVSVIDLDTNTVIQEISVGIGPVGATINPAGDRLWVANSAGAVTVLAIPPSSSP